MVVGDPRQNVYGKAERSVFDFVEKAQDGGEKGWIEVERMSVCHRCPQGHLALVNRLYPPPDHQRIDHPDEPGQGEEAGRLAREASLPVLIGVDTMERRAAAEAMAKELVDRFEEMVAADRAREPATAFHFFAKEANEKGGLREHVLVQRWEVAPAEERARYMARAKATGMRLDDVAVLSPEINNNPLLSCLEEELNRRLRAYAPEKTYRPHDTELPPPTSDGLQRQPIHFGISPFECEEAEWRRKEEEREAKALKSANW